MTREPRSTFTFMRRLSYIASISFTLVFARKSQPLGDFFFLNEQPLHKNSPSVPTQTAVYVLMTFPLPALFFFDGSYWSYWVWNGKGGGGSWSRIFLLLFHENPASRYFFIAFPNSSFVSKSNNNNNNNNNNRRKKSRICLIRISLPRSRF